ncbi:hypothetical protein JCGZ_13507 [Jatropha curcas]|uniref:Pentacotripeptide-repeat region of PRORP domain-containing protein n=1 Tax=Jatropha curcas TaxID=180498 RepID=A0A067KLV3_JATCU|nr:hypothetical protein JCGZ_13507 [Jatropha curcas]
MGIFDSLSYSTSTSSTHLRGKIKSDSFQNIDDALASFDLILRSNRSPPVMELNKILSALVRMKHYATVISLSKQMEMFGISHDICSFNILINCFRHLDCVDFGYSLMGKLFKLGFKPNIIRLTTLIHGLCREDKFVEAVDLFDDIVEKGLQPDVCTYSIMVNGLSKEGLLHEALMVFRKMEGNGCLPDSCSYNVIIQGYLRHKDVSMAKQFIDEMVGKGFSADATTLELVVNDDLLVKKLLSCSKSSQSES